MAKQIGREQIISRRRLMHGILILALTTLTVALPPFAFATSSAGITYQGRIIKPDGTALESSTVQFKLQVRTPNSSNCLMYEEEKTIDMTGSSGMFALTINDGNGTRSDSSGLSLPQIFGNHGTFNFAAGACGGATTFSPSSTDGRKLVVSFNDGSGWETMPTVDINFAPSAIESVQVGGFTADSLLRVQDASGVPQATTPLSPANFTELLSLLNGTSTNYVSSTTSGAALPVLASNTSPNQGDIWFDSGSGRVKYFDGSSTQTVGTSGGSVTSVATGTGLTGGPITTSGTISLATIGSGGTGSKITYDVYGRVTASTSIIGDDITSGTIGGSTAVSTTGNIQTTADMTARRYFLYDHSGAGPNSVGLQAPTTVGTSYTLLFPSTQGGNGQVLANDGLGNLSWTTPSAGTLTSITAGTGLTGGTITSSGTIAVDVGSAANKIVQLDASAKLPAVDGSALTNLNASALTSGTVAAARMPALTGDVTMSAGATATTVAKIQTVPLTITTLASGNYLKYNGTAWVNVIPSSADLSDAGSLIKSSQMPANCGAGQTLTFSSPTGTWVCSNITVTASNFGTQTANTVLAGPTSGGAATPTFRALAAADLPSISSGLTGILPVANGGTGTSDGSITGTGALTFTAGGTNQNVSLAPSGTGSTLLGGNVGIGTSAPTHPLQIESSSWPTINRLTSSTTGWVSALQVQATSSGDMTDNFGAAINYYIQDNAGVSNHIAHISARREGADNSGSLVFATGNAGSVAERMRLSPAGTLGIGISTPATAILQLKAGTATAGTAPLKLTAGTNLTTPENGAMEYDGSSFYLTTGGTRYPIPLSGGSSTFTTVGAGAGSNTAPSLTFSGDNDTGFYDASSNNTISVTAGGVKIFDLSSSGIVSPTTGGADITTANGTAAAPTYSFAGDTGTGWFRAAASTLAASTGGTERIRIDSSGNVGIGTTAPIANLEVQTTLGNSVRGIASTQISSDFYAGAFLGRKARGTPAAPAAVAVNDTLATFGGIGYGATAWSSNQAGRFGILAAENWTDSAQGSYVVISTTPTGATSSIERIRIDSSGNVGIGTTGPQQPLQIGNGLGFAWGTNNNINFNAYWNGGASQYQTLMAGYSGQINQSTTTGNIQIGANNNNAGGANTAISFAYPLQITAAGTVGIGTTNPSAPLHAYTGIARPLILESSGSAGSFIAFKDTNTTSVTNVSLGALANDMTFYTDTGSTRVERMRLNSSGNLGIGTTIPSDLLSVGANATSAGVRQAIRINENGYAAPSADQANSNGDKFVTWNTSGLKTALGVEPSGMWLQSSGINAAHISLYTGPTAGAVPVERVRVDSAGNVGIGTSTPATKLDVNGQVRTGVGTATNPASNAVDFATGNTQVVTFSTCAGNALTVNLYSMMEGGSYSVVVTAPANCVLSFTGTTAANGAGGGTAVSSFAFPGATVYASTGYAMVFSFLRANNVAYCTQVIDLH